VQKGLFYSISFSAIDNTTIMMQTF